MPPPTSAILEYRDNLNAICLDEEVDVALIQRVINEGYATDLNDQEVEIIGRDPFLIAYALVSTNDRCVVTNEISKPGKQRAKRKVPDVCNQMQIDWMDSFRLIRSLDFSTSWRATVGI